MERYSVLCVYFGIYYGVHLSAYFGVHFGVYFGLISVQFLFYFPNFESISQYMTLNRFYHIFCTSLL
jgi:hypothetical protein